MFFASDDVGVLHYSDGHRYGSVDKSKKIIKLLPHDDLLIVREFIIESWKEGNCEKQCKLDEKVLDAYVHNNQIIIVQINTVTVMNIENLKIEQTIYGDFKHFIQFEQGHLFLGGCNLRVISLGDTKNLNKISKLSEGKLLFKSKQKKNAFNGVDDLLYKCAVITSSTTFIATSKHNLHFFDTAHGQRPVVIIPFGTSTISLLQKVNDKDLLLGDVEGNIYLFDYIKKIQVRKYQDKESRSCPTCFAISGNNLFITYLDRYVRHFELSTGKLVHKLYLKNKLTSVLPHIIENSIEADIWNEIPEIS
eukprot:NODE_431_length_8736_cov_0.126780.p4 type:complete len:306 gc:universal NODE_431_length_8736_cov_0.126780:2073-1156(-)